jgi:sterol desaturase/sphingolipid hydroxylase (fatty acid hydroxylase superfamily)
MPREPFDGSGGQEVVMLGIPLGLLYANASEWVIHKYVLHGPEAKKPGGDWSFHWLEHHRNVRIKDFRDPAYEKPLTEWNAQTKEVAALIAAGLLHAPLFPIAPFFTATLWYSMVNYYRVHKRSHLDPEWAREHLPWHYDHHMGVDQDKNWCVTRPWWDIVMGTRVPHIGTERDRKEQEIRAKKRARAAAAIDPSEAVADGATPAERAA